MTYMPNAGAFQHPVVVGGELRIFVFGAALFATLLMGLWVPWFLGFISVPSVMPPAAWRVHELIFGLVPLTAASIVLTAVPGKKPTPGWTLLLLFTLWLAGRLTVATSELLKPCLMANAALSFLAALTIITGWRIIAARAWRHLDVWLAILAMTAAQAYFLVEIMRTGYARSSADLAVALIVLLCTYFAGRVAPTLDGGSDGGRAPLQRFDYVVLIATLVALATWLFLPLVKVFPWGQWAVGLLMLHVVGFHFLRQARWALRQKSSAPFAGVFHIAYAFVGTGFAFTGYGIQSGNPDFMIAGQHAWTAGAVGVMMLGEMCKVTCEYAGRMLTAPSVMEVLYVSVITAAMTLIGAALIPHLTPAFLLVSGAAWCVGFVGSILLHKQLRSNSVLHRPGIT